MTFQRYISLKIVSGTINILLPDDNGIWCSCTGIPFGVNMRVFVQGTAECETASCGIPTFGSGFSSPPTIKRVAVSNHRQSGCHSVFARPHKVSGLIGGALSVFVVNQPVSFGDVNLEGYAACYRDVVAVFVNMFIVGMAGDVCSVCVGVDFPSFEVVVVVARYVCGVHLISAGGDWCVGAVCDIIGVDNGAFLVEVGDRVGLEEHGVEVSLSAVGDAGVQPCLDGGAHTGEGQSGGDVGHTVCSVGGPAFAGNAGRHGAHAGVVNNGVVIALSDIGFLDVERNGGAVGAVERHFQSCVIA